MVCQICRTKNSSYNWKGLKGSFCKQHALPGMVDVYHCKCPVENCDKYSYYNFPGLKNFIVWIISQKEW